METLGREVVEDVTAAARVREIGGDHRVQLDAVQIGAGATERAARGLRVVDELADARIREQLDDRGGQGLADREVATGLLERETEPEEPRLALRIHVGE